MRLDDLKKNLTLTDAITHIEGRLDYVFDGAGQGHLKFRYNENGLFFWSSPYKGFVPVYHDYDDGLFTDAENALAALSPNADHRRAWADRILEVMRKTFLEARLQPGQPVGIVVRGGETDGDRRYVGVIKRINAKESAIVVGYDDGRRTATAHLRPAGKKMAYRGRGGVEVILGGLYK